MDLLPVLAVLLDQVLDELLLHVFVLEVLLRLVVEDGVAQPEVRHGPLVSAPPGVLPVPVGRGGVPPLLPLRGGASLGRHGGRRRVGGSPAKMAASRLRGVSTAVGGLKFGAEGCANVAIYSHPVRFIVLRFLKGYGPDLRRVTTTKRAERLD